MRAHQYLCLVFRVQEFAQHFAFGRFRPQRVAQVVAGRHLPVGKETIILQIRVSERTADGFFGHGDDNLSDALVRQFVEGHKHHGTALARCGRGFHQQVGPLTLFVHHGLHFAHTQFVCRARLPCLGVFYVDKVIYSHIRFLPVSIRL